MSDDLNLRASDGEREATADSLRHHHAEGRLDTDELEARIGRCYAATTTSVLHELVADLAGGVPRAIPAWIALRLRGRIGCRGCLAAAARPGRARERVPRSRPADPQGTDTQHLW